MEKNYVWTDIDRNEKDLNMADFYFFEDVFSDKEMEEIKELAMKYPAEVAGVGQDDTGKVTDTVRKSTVRWMKNAPQWLYERLSE